MNYIAENVSDVVSEYINRTTFLPAIQREFVWEPAAVDWQRVLIRNVQYSSHEIAPRSRLVTPPDRKLHDEGGPRGRAGQRHRPAEPVDAVSQAQKS